MFSAHIYERISTIVFQPDYPGYRPNVVESPNGDGKWDSEKRYAHVAKKYLKEYNTNDWGKATFLEGMLFQANNKALEVAVELGVPKEFWPSIEYSALRILEYPPGSITHPHTDFDLFTLMCYRNIPECFKDLDNDVIEEGFIKTSNPNRLDFSGLYTKIKNADSNFLLDKAKQLNSQIHFGEMLEIINPKFKATKHEVIKDELNRTQYSIVYFAIPDHEAVLPNGMKVKDWLDERLERSRKEKY